MAENYLDHNIQNKKIKDSIKESIEENFPIEAKGRKLLINNVSVVDNLRDDNFPEQKEFKLKRKTWQAPIKADLKLVDTETGKVISKKTNVKIGSIPKLTNRFTTIIDGNEYQTTNQLRRRSGVYATVQRNGELKSEFNLSKGKNFSLFLDPTTQIFSLVYREKNRKYRLWTLLNALGATEKELIAHWGKDLVDINKKGALTTEASELASIYSIVYGKEPTDMSDVLPGLVEYFTTTKVDPDTTKVTLGTSYNKVTVPLLLDASTKLLSIRRGEADPDERDSLIYKDLLGVEDLLEQHFKKQQPLLKSKIARTMNLTDDVRSIISAATFTKPIKTFFTTGDLTNTPEQTNPVKIVSDWRQTTPMGTGGITSPHQITLETRDVQPTHLGFLDPLATPESGRVGVTVGLASETTKSDSGILTPVYKPNGTKSKIDPITFYNSVVGMPDQYYLDGTTPKARFRSIKAYSKGQPIWTSPAKVDYYMQAPQSMFSYKANLIPFLPTVQSNRASMGGKMITQAVPLDNKEAPLVQVLRSKNETYEDLMGSFLNPRLGVDPSTRKSRKGTVESITKDYVTIKLKGGKKIKRGLYHNFPLNQDGFLHSTPLVNVGDTVDSTTMLAENNYSDNKTLALGKNLNVAYMSYKGYNFEDAAVMTESAAEKLAHTMIHKINVFFTPKNTILSLSRFRSNFPSELSAENAAKLDEKGVMKKGQKVLPGEVVVAYMVEKEMDAQDQALRRLDKVVFSPWKKRTSTWDYDEEGVVTDVSVTGRNIDVYIKSSHPLKEGDKISGRYGNKSIITKIIPDDDAPHSKDGIPIDLMLNPHGVPGRMNTGQLLETAAGKLAAKTGKIYKVKNFNDPNSDITKDLLKELKANKIKTDEILTDGKTGRPFENKIFTGKQYIMKLRHHVEKKHAAHGLGSYDINEQPTGSGAQKIGPDLSYALLAHGAKNTMRDMSEIKSRKNDEYWRNVQLGLPPIKPNRNFVFDKLVHYLKAGGVNVEKEGNKLQMMPLTDKVVKKLSNGEITEPAAILMGKNLSERKGGLFDKEITGGMLGANWAHIKLAKRIPNPMYEGAIIKALDLTVPTYNSILKGETELDGDTGSEAIVKALKKVDPKKRLKILKEELKDAPPTNINVLNTKVRNMQALVDLKMSTDEAYTTQFVPILPPKFRPIYPLPSGDLVPSDINKHYRDIGAINQTYKTALKENILRREDVDKSDLALYDSMKAMQGFIDPVTYGKQKYKGIIKELRGKDQAKTGFIQGAAWSKRQDLSARSTITVEPTLGIDQVGLPKEMAYTIYQPFMVRKLKKMGIPTSDAIKYIKEENAFADKALLNVMEERPVFLNRAPSLHKHSVQAFNPVISKGSSIRLNPLIVKGFNADFDGDTMGVHVPVSVESVEEARNLVPSKILFKHGDNTLVPGLSQDYQLGIYHLSKITGKADKKYNTLSEAKKDHANNTIKMTTQVQIGGVNTSIGQYMLNAPLPKALKNYSRLLDGPTVKSLLESLGKDYPTKFVDVINSWKNLGAMYSHIRGTTLSIEDFGKSRAYRDEILKKELPKLQNLSSKKQIEGLNKITALVQKAQDKTMSGKNNAYDMLNSGSLSKGGNVRQMMSMPGVLTDVRGNPLSIPVLKSYAEGLDTGDYFNTHYAARKGTVDRAVNTQDSGALNKALLTVSRRLLITMTDCATTKGIEVEVDSKDVLDRRSLETIKGVIKKNQLIDSDTILTLKKSKITNLKVRSPLTCEAAQGLCQNCYGLLPDGSIPGIGTNVGALDAHAVTERSTQLTMQTFHTGGAVNTGGSVAQSFPRLKQLIYVPQTLKGQATLSSVKGKVKAIDKNLTGGFDVRIEGYGTANDKTITIPSGRLPVIKKGDKVDKGDKLSEGSIKPQELGELKDHLTAQKYIVNELDGIFGNKFYKKTFETVVRSISDNAIVTDAPEKSGFYRGDKSSTSYLKQFNKERRKEGLAPVRFKEYFKSVDTINVDYPDFLTQFTTNRFKNALTTGAAKGNYANIKGNDPIPAYIYGEDFGKGSLEKGEFY